MLDTCRSNAQSCSTAAPLAPCHNSVINIAAVESIGPTSEYCRPAICSLHVPLARSHDARPVVIDQAFQLARIKIDHHTPMSTQPSGEACIGQPRRFHGLSSFFPSLRVTSSRGRKPVSPRCSGSRQEPIEALIAVYIDGFFATCK